MDRLPVLETKRLLLRPFILEDAPEVAHQVDDFALYRTTLHLPYPYDEAMAVSWISTHENQWLEKGLVTLALVVKETNLLVGAISLGPDARKTTGEIGYWVGKSHWGRGYATEALKPLLDFGFSSMGLHRIQGRYLALNPASGRVMEKCGMGYEGLLRGSIWKGGYPHDVGFHGLTRGDFLKDGRRSMAKPERRMATKEDAYALHVIQEKAFAEDLMRYGDRRDCPAKESFDVLLSKIAGGGYHALLENGTLIGGADVRRERASNTARLARVFLDPSYHRLGLGRWFLQELEAHYDDAARWVLDTPHGNPRNHRFYEALGYKKVGERPIDDALTLYDYEKTRTPDAGEG